MGLAAGRGHHRKGNEAWWRKLDEKHLLESGVSLLCLNCIKKKATRFSAAGASADARENSGEKIKMELAWNLCNQRKYLGDLLL